MSAPRKRPIRRYTVLTQRLLWGGEERRFVYRGRQIKSLGGGRTRVPLNTEH